MEKNLKKNRIYILYTILFLVLYFTIICSLLISKYVIGNFFFTIIIIGHCFILLGLIYFAFIYNQSEPKFLFETKFLSEDTIKLILIISMSIVIFIPPVSFSKTVINWDEINFFVLIRALIFIIGCAFVPGSNLYNIIFHNSKIHERFDVEPFLLKITFYPILSFLFIGILVLMFDIIGITTEFFPFLLFLSLLLLCFADFIIQKLRGNDIKIKTKRLSLSKNSFIILLISLGVLLISLGIHLSLEYLIPGDSWVGVSPANYIGDPSENPINYGTERNYPIFWGYIIYGLSALSGLPFINTNAMLAPFSYLFILLIYLFMKSLTTDMDEKYAVFATILIAIFGGLFYIPSNLGTISILHFIFYFQFIYKSYAYCLFFMGIALFFIATKTTNPEEFKKIRFNETFFIIFLSALFILGAYMLYMIPLLIAIPFLFIYCIFSKNKETNFQSLKIFIVLFIILFFFFDILMNFFLSYILLNKVFLILVYTSIMSSLNSFYLLFIVYLIFIIILALVFFINYLYVKIYPKIKDRLTRLKINSKYTFFFFLIIFLGSLIIEVSIIILEEFILNENVFTKNIYYFYYTNMIFTYIGFIGIIGLFLIQYTYKKNKNLFYILIVWTIFSLLFASLLLYKSILFDSPPIKELGHTKYRMPLFWFSRIWFFSILSLALLASIGLIELIDYIKEKESYRNKSNQTKVIIKFSVISILIILSYSNIVISSGEWSYRDRKVRDSEANVIGWVSENLPDGSNIVVDNRYPLYRGIDVMTKCNPFYINFIFEEDMNNLEYIEQINYLKSMKMKYLIIQTGYIYLDSNLSSFVDEYLIPNFYNECLYDYMDMMAVYYAPYYD